jgi:hypothetical protein
LQYRERIKEQGVRKLGEGLVFIAEVNCRSWFSRSATSGMRVLG